MEKLSFFNVETHKLLASFKKKCMLSNKKKKEWANTDTMENTCLQRIKINKVNVCFTLTAI